MSLGRLVYYSAILAGWAAFAAWSISETAILGRMPFEVILTAAVLGAAIGCGVNVAAGLSGNGLQAVFQRALPGLIGGALGGAIGGVLGDVAFNIGLPRALGWMLMGTGIGVVEGLQEQSFTKIRNGLIGGAIGGLLGGFLFDIIQAFVASGSGMSSRATAFVVLGLAIGACIGLAQVVLKEAWLTVIDGYRPGRQLILSRPVTILGRAEHLPLAFLGTMNANVSPEHVRISRQPNGSFVIEDVGGGQPALRNRQPVSDPTRLSDGDLIKLGPNIIRFNERQARQPDRNDAGEGSPNGGTMKQQPRSAAPPPPPPPPKASSAVRPSPSANVRPLPSPQQVGRPALPGSQLPRREPPPPPPPPKR